MRKSRMLRVNYDFDKTITKYQDDIKKKTGKKVQKTKIQKFFADLLPKDLFEGFEEIEITKRGELRLRRKKK